MTQWNSTPEYVDAMEVASQPQVDAHLLLELAHFNPYFLVKVVSPHQLPPGLMTTALQLAIVREMGGYKYVQMDYEEYKHDMRYRAHMEMQGPEWPEENNWLAGFNRLTGGMDHRAIMGARLSGFPEALLRRDLGTSLEDICLRLRPGSHSYLKEIMAMGVSEDELRPMVVDYLENGPPSAPAFDEPQADMSEWQAFCARLGEPPENVWTGDGSFDDFDQMYGDDNAIGAYLTAAPSLTWTQIYALAERHPYVLASYVSPSQLPGPWDEAHQNEVLKYLPESWDEVLEDYSAYQDDWYEGWNGEEEEPDWSVCDWAESMSRLVAWTPDVQAELVARGYDMDPLPPMLEMWSEEEFDMRMAESRMAPTSRAAEACRLVRVEGLSLDKAAWEMGMGAVTIARCLLALDAGSA